MPRRSKKVEAWRKARAINYSETLSKDALARMVVELEDAGKYVPEFEIDDEWPERVAYLRVK